MSTISKKLVGFLYGGAAQVLASASWKTNANAVYGINSEGTGYQVFKPGNTFNSLTQLVADGFYILDANKLGFDLPGATLTTVGGGSAVSPLTVSDFSAVAQTYANGQQAIEIDFGINSTDAADFGVAMVVWNETTGFLQGVFDMGGVNSAATGAITVGALGSTLTDTYRLHLLTNEGHLFTKTFVAAC